MLGWICCSQLVLLRCPLWRPTLRSVDLLAFVNEAWGDEADGESASTPAAVEAPLLTSVLQDELGRLQTERARTPQRRGNSNGTRALSQAQGAQGAPSTAGVWEHDLSLWKELGVAPPSDEAPLSAHTASGAVVETGTRTEDETAATRQQGRQALEERARCLLLRAGRAVREEVPRVEADAEDDVRRRAHEAEGGEGEDDGEDVRVDKRRGAG